MKEGNRTALQRHTAQPSLEGYTYQIQQAILRLFRLEEGYSLGIEVVDDIHIESEGNQTEFVQVKNHRAGPEIPMSGASADFWKTLGIWATAIRDKSIDLACFQHFTISS